VTPRLVLPALVVSLAVCGASWASPPYRDAIDLAQDHFYNARYNAALQAVEQLDAGNRQLEAYELRTSIILFKIRRAIGDAEGDKGKAFKACVTCGDLMAEFMREFNEGRAAAREAVKLAPDDPDALFYLGKLDLNYLWLMLGSVGRRTGWDEFWEARRSLDAAIRKQPDSVRARVARAWIEYIVDTRTPWGTGWLLGGGSRKKALAMMKDAVVNDDDFYAHAEAMFGLWDMLVREKRDTEALEIARQLTGMFPENPEVARFVASKAH
jgi:tetratricopeptide (TPR) repeat protein